MDLAAEMQTLLDSGDVVKQHVFVGLVMEQTDVSVLKVAELVVALAEQTATAEDIVVLEL